MTVSPFEDTMAVVGAREVVWVLGPDAVRFVDGLVSQDVAALEVGGVARSLLLSPRGKLVAVLWVLRGEQRVGLATDAGMAVVVAAQLNRFRIRVDATVSIEAAPVVEAWGPDADTVASAVIGAGFVEASGWREVGQHVAFRVPSRHGVVNRVGIVGASVDELVAAGAVTVSPALIDSVRIDAGEPVVGVDLDTSVIPAEADLVEGAVSFTKGCYLGQELVARIDSRGHVNRHLRAVVLDGVDPPPVGAAVRRGDDEVGVLTTTGRSGITGKPAGLGLLRREATPGDAVIVLCDDRQVAAVVREVPVAQDAVVE